MANLSICSRYRQASIILKSAGIYRCEMRSIIASVIILALMALILPSIALSPVEQAYQDGVKEGLKLGELINDVERYNLAVQQFNDHLNQTFGANASLMWLPKKEAPVTVATGKPVHKIDGTPSEISLIQY